MPNVLAHRFLILRRFIQHFWTNPTRLPELDEKTVKVHPLDIGRTLPKVGGVRDGTVRFGYVDRDLMEIPVVRCDGLESQGHPPRGRSSNPKHHFLEFWRVREVERCDRPWFCKQKPSPEASVPTQNPKEHTMPNMPNFDINAFKCGGTCLHQSHRPQNVFLSFPLAH